MGPPDRHVGVLIQWSIPCKDSPVEGIVQGMQGRHGGGPVAPQGPQIRAGLLLQVAGGAKEELEAGQVQPGGQRELFTSTHFLVKPRRGSRVSRGSQGSIHDTKNLFCHMQEVRQGWAGKDAHSTSWRSVRILCKKEQATHRAGDTGLCRGPPCGAVGQEAVSCAQDS